MPSCSRAHPVAEAPPEVLAASARQLAALYAEQQELSGGGDGDYEILGLCLDPYTTLIGFL